MRVTWHTQPQEETWDQAYNPHPCEQTHASENITFPQLRWPVVIMEFRQYRKNGNPDYLTGALQ